MFPFSSQLVMMSNYCCVFIFIIIILNGVTVKPMSVNINTLNSSNVLVTKPLNPFINDISENKTNDVGFNSLPLTVEQYQHYDTSTTQTKPIPLVELDNRTTPAASTNQNKTNNNGSVPGWQCHCFDTSMRDGFDNNDIPCECEGPMLLRIPQRLPLGMQRLNINKAGLKLLRATGLKVYSKSLQDFMLTDLNDFEHIEAGAFDGLEVLRTIYISHSPKLKYLNADVFRGIPETLKSVRIIYCSLQHIPDLRLFSSNIILYMLDLEGNQIKEIEENSVRIKTEQMILDNNALTYIDKNAFQGSQIAQLSLKGNQNLKKLHPYAFTESGNIQELDLSGTSLETLPTKGLQDLEILRIQNTHTLKQIPSVYNFKNLREAWLTHPFHCCAFKFPSRHDPEKHAERLKYIKSLQQQCIDNGHKDSVNNKHVNGMDNDEYRNRSELQVLKAQKRTKRGFTNDINNGTVLGTNEDNGMQNAIDYGHFLPTLVDVFSNNIHSVCGNMTIKEVDVKCYPMPDALNPCEDVMGSQWLRISVWIVVFLAVFGNVIVLVVLFANWKDVTVPKFLMCHLAFADLCMGLYLLLIASIDLHSMGEYFNYAFDWQYGFGCKAAGFLTVFAGHLSVFTLIIITLERWFAIARAIYLNQRIRLKSACFIMLSGWIFSIMMSSLPLFGVSNYSSTSICLPMEARDSLDITFLVTIVSVSGFGFVGIAVCYSQIYLSLGKETRHRSGQTPRGEMSIAKKMALLVFTNFACWAPIAFFSLTALAGYPLIDVAKSKILLVFFYPLNSCADPYLYAILTVQYRRDLYNLLSKYGFCVKRAQQYKISFSLPTTNQSCPMPLLDRKVSVQPEIEENEEEKCLNHVRHETNAEEFV